MGDDANNILVLDADYRRVDSIRLFSFPGKTIPKSEKVDFESSTLVSSEGKLQLLVLGSASREQRKKLMLIPVLEQGMGTQTLEEFNTTEFINRIVAKGIEEINIEGVALVRSQFLLANRGNILLPRNHLIRTDDLFWKNQMTAAISILQIVVPVGMNGFIGVSELCYLASSDILLLTFSSELTTNSYDDGPIGDSYIGWIDDISMKLNNLNLAVDGLVNLIDVDPAFKMEKIEGLCLEAFTNNECILHLASDNDLGETKLFKIRMIL